MQPALRPNLPRQQDMDYALGPLRAKFVGDLPARAETIDALMLAAEGGGDPTPALRRIQDVVHRLAGVAAILGFPTVGDLSQRCEMAVVRHLGTGAGGLDEIGGLLDDLVVEMERQGRVGVQPAGPGGAPPHDA